jgi:hypothetical protein
MSRANHEVLVAATDLYDGVAETRSDPHFVNVVESVRVTHASVIDDQFLSVGQLDSHAVVVARPRPGRVVEPARYVIEPVHTGDGEEAVRARPPELVVAMPTLPLSGEGGMVVFVKHRTSGAGRDSNPVAVDGETTASCDDGPGTLNPRPSSF